jgi:hypothetical protein
MAGLGIQAPYDTPGHLFLHPPRVASHARSRAHEEEEYNTCRAPSGSSGSPTLLSQMREG